MGSVQETVSVPTPRTAVTLAIRAGEEMAGAETESDAVPVPRAFTPCAVMA